VLIKAIADYADTYLPDQLAESAFEQKPVPFALMIGLDGSFVQIATRTYEVTYGKKTVVKSHQMTVPKSPVHRSNGEHPLVGCDSIKYVVGPQLGAWTPPDKEGNHQKRHTGFVTLINDLANELETPILHACSSFYGNPAAVEKAREELVKMKATEGALVALSVVDLDSEDKDGGKLVVDDPVVRDYWAKHYDEEYNSNRVSKKEAMCLISGKVGPYSTTHDPIKGAGSLGGQASGVSLMSYDKGAFQSYGWKKNANGPVCPDRANAYVLGLNDLLKRGEHRVGDNDDVIVHTRYDVGKTCLIFWTREPSNEDILSYLTDSTRVHSLLCAPESGNDMAANIEGIDNRFYMFTASANGGRLLIHTWLDQPLPQIKSNMRDYFRILQVPDIFNGGKSAKPPMLHTLVMAAATPESKFKDTTNATRALQLTRRAIEGIPVGLPLLAATLKRIYSERGPNRISSVRISLIQLCINDLTQRHTKEGNGTMTNPREEEENNNPGFICGQLFAVYEYLQYKAHGKKVNSSITDRYYSLAAVRPLHAFTTLDRRCKAHLQKLRRENTGAAISIDREISAIVDRLSFYPERLSMIDQGRFNIGYHHKRAEGARRAAEAKRGKEGEEKREEVKAN
jgi:CRISPR-associated protein Csd1